MFFLHYFLPNPILFSFGPLTVRWYGFFIALGFLAGLIVALRLAKKKNIDSEKIYDLAFWLAVSAIFFARIFAVFFYDFAYYQNQLGEIIKIWHGGLSIHGAIFGGALALIFWCRKNKINTLKLPPLNKGLNATIRSINGRSPGQSEEGSDNFLFWADLLAPALALGQAIGRWGNYFNQELFGRPTGAPWGIPIAPENRPAQFASAEYFQPTFLFESILDLILFFGLIGYAKKSPPNGRVAGVYFLGYGFIRLALEFLRADIQPPIFGLRLGMVFSLTLIILGIGIFWRQRRGG